MTPWDSIILGGIQGVTEFLPVSSSAHLIIVPHLFGIDDGGINKLTYDVMLHFGTLLAVLMLYGKRFLRILADAWSDLRSRRIMESMLAKIVVATIPAAVLGLVFKGFIEAYLRTPSVTIGTLIAVSVLMLVVERLARSGGEITYGTALMIGVAQAMALVPGVSRSGITIVAALFLGLRRSEAVDFSFLISIPIIAGTALLEARHIDAGGGFGSIYLSGMLSAFAFGALSLWFLVRFLRGHRLDPFAYYRIALALFLLFFVH